MSLICYVGLPGKLGRCVSTPPNPIHPVRPKPKPDQGAGESGLYQQHIVDVTILDSIHSAAKGITDDGARAAIESGVQSAVAAVKKRAGGEIEGITLGD